MEPEWFHLYWNAPNLAGAIACPERTAEFISENHNLTGSEIVYLCHFKRAFFKETSQYNLISGKGIKSLLQGKSPGAVCNTNNFSTVNYYLHLFGGYGRDRTGKGNPNVVFIFSQS